jgi:hypothetical protein
MLIIILEPWRVEFIAGSDPFIRKTAINYFVGYQGFYISMATIIYTKRMRDWFISYNIRPVVGPSVLMCAHAKAWDANN